MELINTKDLYENDAFVIIEAEFEDSETKSECRKFRWDLKTTKGILQKFVPFTASNFNRKGPAAVKRLSPGPFLIPDCTALFSLSIRAVMRQGTASLFQWREVHRRAGKGPVRNLLFHIKYAVVFRNNHKFRSTDRCVIIGKVQCVPPTVGIFLKSLCRRVFFLLAMGFTSSILERSSFFASCARYFSSFNAAQ